MPSADGGVPISPAGKFDMKFLTSLVTTFYPSLGELGEFREVPRDAMPDPYAQLLVHEHHMTVTVEQYHDSLVDVHVLDRKRQHDDYARKILLSRQSDHAIVMYGIVRIRLPYLDPEIRERVLAEQTPLGRILIEHNVLRRIHLVKVWEVRTGLELAGHLACTPGDVTFGRTAFIFCDEVPAIELLEIVSPVKRS